jgi:antitoxin VapB
MVVDSSALIAIALREGSNPRLGGGGEDRLAGGVLPAGHRGEGGGRWGDKDGRVVYTPWQEIYTEWQSSFARRRRRENQKAGREAGETLTDAVEKAVDQRLVRLAAKRGRIDREKLAAAQAYFDALPRMNEHLTDDEVIGYNEWGTFG